MNVKIDKENKQVKILYYNETYGTSLKVINYNNDMELKDIINNL